MIGQHGIRRTKEGPPIRHNAVEKCLGRVAQKAVELDASVHMPRIGCGLAGGNWEEIEPIITRQLCKKSIAVYVYDRE
jgi:O-acetyl-ADP-ribose deacetylase (regulator of RNase III)